MTSQDAPAGPVALPLLSHRLRWDPTAGALPLRRWTCGTCGAWMVQSGRTVYGSAVEQSCETKEGDHG